MEAQIQVRRGTAAQWISANPILTAGEPGLETDTGKGKYGDGTKHWNTLGYSWSLLSLGPQGPAGGSLTGNYPNPTLNTNTVGAPQIIDGSVDTAELKDLAVKTAKLDNLAVTTAKIGDGQVTPAKLSGNIGSAQIADGSIALVDLDPLTVSALKVDVLDEGAVTLADADKINFSGAGVAVTAGNGVATVTITGAPATAIVAGTMADWYDPVAPAGWYRCDGTAHADLGGTLGTRYGAAPGTVPNIFGLPVDYGTNVISEVITSTQPGWHVDSVAARRTAGQIHMSIQVTRTGADIVLGNPNHGDQSMAIVKAPWIPDYTTGGACWDTIRHFALTGSGNITLTSGFGTHASDDYDISKNDVFQMYTSFPIALNAVVPKVYKIIKAP